MPSRDVKRVKDPFQINFTEVYNENRFEVQEDAPLTVFSQREKLQNFLSRFHKAEDTRKAVRNAYTIIRSDLDEDRDYHHVHQDKSMPRMLEPSGNVARHVESLKGAGNASQVARLRFLLFVDSMWFQSLSGGVICLNAILIGLETDIDSDKWWWIDQFMLLFFFVELAMKMCRHGRDFFKSEDEWLWNFFDFGIVVSGVFDQWLMPLEQYVMAHTTSSAKQSRSHMTVFFMLLRMARLLRIVRVFRLIKMVRPLYELAQGILEALQGMFWVLVFMSMTLYACAILCDLFIGGGEVFSEEVSDEDSAPFRKMFDGVSASLFALFGTVSSWSLEKLIPLFHQAPAFRLFFVVFYIYSSWALLAVMTGVVSENMIAIRDQMVKEDARKEELRQDQIILLLKDLFEKADIDRSGQISRDEFKWMLSSPVLVRKLGKFSKIDVKDLEELFNWIDNDGSGTINQEEFLEGFKWITEPLRAKSLVRLFQRLVDDVRLIKKNVIQRITEKAEEVNSLIWEPLRKVHAICELMQSLDTNFGNVLQAVQEPRSSPTEQELAEVEQRLTMKLQKVLRRLEEVERASFASQANSDS